MRYTTCGRFEITEQEIKSLSSKISSAKINLNSIVITHIEKFTEQEDNAICNLLNSKMYDEKATYTAATAAEKQDMIAKKLGLLK